MGGLLMKTEKITLKELLSVVRTDIIKVMPINNNIEVYFN